MKLLPLFILVLAFSACSKEKDTLYNDGLSGNWQLTAVFGGNAKGVNFAWRKTPDTYSETITLLPTGQYCKTTTDSGTTNRQCGRYQLTEGNQLSFHPIDGTPTENMTIQEQTPNSLILQKHSTEGFIRLAYIPKEEM